MDCLRDKQLKNYTYTSRYSPFYIYYNENDNKYMYELSKNVEVNKNYVLHKISQTDTLDSLANKYYGRPDLFWIIAQFNNINDCFVNLWEHYSELKIPPMTNITYTNLR